MTITAERVAAFVFAHHVVPARESGEHIVMIPVRQVWKALDGEFPLDLIRGVLGSTRFRNTYHLALVAAEGLEDPPDTYVFKLRTGQAFENLE
ncbi:MAG TPA: hypothetical protein VG204_03885 [Terriglobia bacterium]|nr:hypothetical protein [Terriglobia bacterium]